MIACVIHGAKDLRVQEQSDPEPGAGEAIVRFGAGGICGSDLHYYFEGGIGDVKIKEPMIVGHEVAGEVVAIGPEVQKIKPGDRVAVNPTRACLQCPECLSGHSNLCRNVLFFGSASSLPHVPGAFASLFRATERQCVPVPAKMSFRVAASAEPLAVALHAVAQSGPLLGKAVLVTGSGPIGILVTAAARLAGASRITVTDLFDEPLQTALEMGAGEVVNVKKQPDLLTKFERDRGQFDAAFEASGNARALETCIASVRPGGRIVQIGIMPAGNAAVPINKIMAKELQLIGSFRFYDEFNWAVNLLAASRLDLTPIFSAEYPFSRAVEAFELASDRHRAVKVSLVVG